MTTSFYRKYQKITNNVRTSDRKTWERKQGKLIILHNEIQPIEEQILELKKQANDCTTLERKQGTLIILQGETQPIEEQILELKKQHSELTQKIQHIRNDLVKNCIHPENEIIELDDNVFLCKFCNRRLKVIIP